MSDGPWSDDAPENFYGQGYGRVYMRDGSWFSLHRDDIDRVRALWMAGKPFVEECRDVDGDTYDIKCAEVNSITRVTPAGMDRVAAYQDWVEQRRKSTKPFD